MPHPPPLKPPEGAEEEKRELKPEEQPKEDISFLTVFDEHFGHSVSSSLEFTFCKKRKLLITLSA